MEKTAIKLGNTFKGTINKRESLSGQDARMFIRLMELCGAHAEHVVNKADPTSIEIMTAYFEVMYDCTQPSSHDAELHTEYPPPPEVFEVKVTCCFDYQVSIKRASTGKYLQTITIRSQGRSRAKGWHVDYQARMGSRRLTQTVQAFNESIKAIKMILWDATLSDGAAFRRLGREYAEFDEPTLYDTERKPF